MSDHPAFEGECPCRFCPCVLDVWDVVEGGELTPEQFEELSRKMKRSS